MYDNKNAREMCNGRVNKTTAAKVVSLCIYCVYARAIVPHTRTRFFTFDTLRERWCILYTLRYYATRESRRRIVIGMGL